MSIAQPFSPALFTQGPLEGAELLMSFLRGDVPEGELYFGIELEAYVPMGRVTKGAMKKFPASVKSV